MEHSTWSVLATSAANTAQSVTRSGAASQCHYVTGYLVTARAADVGADAAVEVRDSDDNVYWRDYFGNAQKRGSKCGATFPKPIRLPEGKGAKLHCAALGAACIAELTLTGYTR